MNGIVDKSITQQKHEVESYIHFDNLSLEFNELGMTSSGAIIEVGSGQLQNFNKSAWDIQRVTVLIGGARPYEPSSNQRGTIQGRPAFHSVGNKSNSFNRSKRITLKDDRFLNVTRPLASSIEDLQMPIELFRPNLLSDLEIKNIASLNESFRRELRMIERLTNINPTNISKAFESIRKALATLPFNGCAVEFDEELGLKVTLAFENEQLLMVTKSTEQDNTKDKIIYSFFVKRRLAASGLIDLQRFAKMFNQYLNN
jgi:hypothetical protein